MKTFAQWVIALTRGYIKATGKKPNKLAQLKIKMEAGQKVKDQGKVIEFPRDRITDWTKPRPTTGKKADVTELDDPLINEFAGPPSVGAGQGMADSIQAQKIKQGFSTQSKLNSKRDNQGWVKDFIERRNAEFNFLNKDDQKIVLNMFEKEIKRNLNLQAVVSQVC